MVSRNAQREKDLAEVAERALRASGMDSVGLYTFDDRLNPEAGVILGMPDAFSRAYEVTGMRIDPVLDTMRRTGAPCSTVTCLGDRWRNSQLYTRVSGRFGLTGFAALPLYREDTLAGILYMGALTEDSARRLSMEGICAMSPHATRISTRLLALPQRDHALTDRQNAVAELAARGLGNAEIAAELGTGEASVRKHLKALNRIYGTTNRTAMAAAWRARL